MRPVHVGVGHDDDLVVTQASQVFGFLLLALFVAHGRGGADGRDEIADFLVPKHLIRAGSLDIEDLAAKRQNGLEARIAPLLGRAAGRVALDDEQFGFLRLLGLAVGQLAGQRMVGQRPLAAHQLLGLAGGFPGPGRVHGLFDDGLGVLGIFLEMDVDRLENDLGHEPRHFGVAELGLGLALELGLGELDGNDGGETLAHVVAGELLLEFLGDVGFFDVGVDGPGQRRLKSLQVGAAFAGADVVGEGEDFFLVIGVILQGEVHHDALDLALALDDLVDDLLAGVEVGDEPIEAAVEAVGHPLIGAFVAEIQLQLAVEVGQFLEALGQGLVVELAGLKYLLVGQKPYGGAGVLGLADHGQGGDGRAALVALVVLLAAPAHRDFEILRQGVDHRDAHAVQAAGDLVGVVVELAAGMEHGHDHFDGRPAFLGVDVHRNAAAVVRDGDRVVQVDGDADAVAVAGHGLVDGVIHDFIHEMVQAPDVGGADIHGRALAHGRKPLQDGNGAGVVGLGRLVLTHAMSSSL